MPNSPEKACCTNTKTTKIKVEEHGKKAVFLNKSKEKFVKIRVDGCIIKNETAADWVVSKSDVGDVIVELKGKDVHTGAKQVEKTAGHWKEKGYCVGKLAALIVSNQFPKANTEIRKAQERFRQSFKGPLHVVTKNFEGSIEAVLSSKGPHKVS